MQKGQVSKYKIPDVPGVYFWKDQKGILYIGKATSLRDRIKSYFATDLIETRGPLIVDMVTRATGIAWEESSSVLEALVRESALIKQHQPYYNTKEKDDKSYYYVCITKSDHPIVFLERGKNIDFSSLKTATYKLSAVYGPFPSGPMIREGLRILRKIFPFDDASSIKRQQSTFYKQLGLSPAGQKSEYVKSIKKLGMYLSGRVGALVREMEHNMKTLAKVGKFEQAARVRDQLFALQHINDVSLLKRDGQVASHAGFRIEAYDIAHLGGGSMVGAMVVIEQGEPKKSEYRKFIIRSVFKSNDPAALQEILSRRLGHPEWRMPDLIVVDGNKIQYDVAKKVLSEKKQIPVVAVTKNERHKPKALYGDAQSIKTFRDAILLANAEAHRYVILFHRNRRGKRFLGK